jgi:hypothetical protein
VETARDAVGPAEQAASRQAIAAAPSAREIGGAIGAVWHTLKNINS